MSDKKHLIWQIPFAIAAISATIYFLVPQSEKPTFFEDDIRASTLGVLVTPVAHGRLQVVNVNQYGREFGFQVGDLLDEVNKKSVHSVRDYVEAVGSRTAIQNVRVTLLRNDERIVLFGKFEGPIGRTSMPPIQQSWPRSHSKAKPTLIASNPPRVSPPPTKNPAPQFVPTIPSPVL